MATIDITAAFIDANGDAVAPTSPVIDIRGPTGTLLVDGAAMDMLAAETGVYEYTYTVPATDGVYYYYVHATIGTATPVHAGAFTVRDSGATVRKGVHAEPSETVRIPFALNDSDGSAIAAVTAVATVYETGEGAVGAPQDISGQTGDNTGEYYAVVDTTGLAGIYRVAVQFDDGASAPCIALTFDVIAPAGATAITVSGVTVDPVSPTTADEIDVTFSTDLPASEGIVILSGGRDYAALVKLSGLNGIARFNADTVRVGTYTVIVLVTDGSLSGFDDSQSVSVSAAPVTTDTAPYVPFVDELEVIHALLRDPERNFHLTDVIPALEQNTAGGSADENDRTIIFRNPDTVGQYPAIEVSILGLGSVKYGEVMEEGYLVDSYRFRVEIRVMMPRDYKIEYAGRTYKDSFKGLRLIAFIIRTIFAHNYEHCGLDGLLTWDDVTMDFMDMIPGEAPQNIDTVVQQFTFSMMARRPYYSGASIP